jgi:NADH-quinone oxidoreductase subunit N
MILMGAALLYLQTGDLSVAGMARASTDFATQPLGVVGAVLLMSGMAFKLALAPFHSWAPDVYQAAPSTLTGYMAALVKLSVALVMLRWLEAGLGHGSGFLVVFFWVVGALSIAIGSLFGLVHNSIRRMLAYSSVANAGYFCLSFAALAAQPDSVAAREGLVAYAVIYAVLSLGTFAVVAWFEENNREDLLREDLAGVGREAPFASVCLTIFLLGLAGIPPLAGFFGKLMLIQASVSTGLIGLAVILALFSCIGLYYYLAVIVEVWLKARSRHTINVVHGGDFAHLPRLVGVIALVSVVLGIMGPRWAQGISSTRASQKPVAHQNPSP